MKLVLSLSAMFCASLAFASCATVSVQPATAPERVSAMSIEDIMPLVDDKVQSYGADRVLVVFDVDDTLLTMSQDLGGVGWYDWQDALGDEPGDQAGEIGSTLLDVQGVLFEAARMKPVEETTLSVLNNLRQRGVATHGLTARGPDYFGATYRELRKNDLELGIHTDCKAPLCARPGVLTFEEVQASLLNDFTAAELDEIGLKSSRPAIVGNGILMVAGQHKGLMLHLLIKSYPESDFDAVIFIDDAASNVDDLLEVAEFMPQAVTIVHYERLNHHNAALQNDRKRISEAAAAWEGIETAICATMTARVCE